MKFKYGKAIYTFIVGFIISIVVAIVFESPEMGIITSVCYVGAVLVGLFSDRDFESNADE